MKDYKSLKVMDRFRSLFERFDIDYTSMRRILQLKLTMDTRRTPAMFNSQKPKNGKNQFLRSLWIYVFYGAVGLTPFLFFPSQYMLSMGIAFTVLMFIAMTAMVSDFSAVLLDIRDKNILQPKPINNRTLNAAKIMHIVIYLSMLNSALIIVPLVVGAIRFGILFGLLFIVMAALLNCFIVVLTALIYLFILRFFSGEKLKDLINYVQIILTVSIMVGYQFMARSFELTQVAVTYQFAWWHIFLPPLWYSAFMEMVLHQAWSGQLLLLSILGILMPILSIVLYVKLMPTFERNLSKLLSDSSRQRGKTHVWTNLWSKILCSDPQERVFFNFASLMMSRERSFKLKAYPQIGFSLVMPFVFLLNTSRSFSIKAIQENGSVMVLYFTMIMLPSIVHLLKFSDKYKSYWIYRVAPVADDRIFYSATLKACYVKLFLPLFIVVSSLFVAIFSWRVLPSVGIMLLISVLLLWISYVMGSKERYPFSSSLEATQDTGTIRLLTSMLLLGILVLVHLGLSHLQYGLTFYAVLLIGIIFGGWKYSFGKRKVKNT